VPRWGPAPTMPNAGRSTFTDPWLATGLQTRENIAVRVVERDGREPQNIGSRQSAHPRRRQQIHGSAVAAVCERADPQAQRTAERRGSVGGSHESTGPATGFPMRRCRYPVKAMDFSRNRRNPARERFQRQRSGAPRKARADAELPHLASPDSDGNSGPSGTERRVGPHQPANRGLSTRGRALMDENSRPMAPRPALRYL